MLGNKAMELARGLIKGYYSHAKLNLDNVEKREFGFGDFEQKIRYRHYAFGSVEALRRYMIENTPPFVSYSPAFYEHPDGRPMPAKKWMGSELVFDLDATDLKLDCQKTHPGSWVCGNCLDKVKEETVKLVEDFLYPDFGFTKDEIRINFSGNRGYHVHVRNESAFTVGAKGRIQIGEYITGTNILPQALFPTMGNRGVTLKGPRPTDGGWGGKLARGMITALNEGEESLARLGIERPIARKLIRNKADVLLGISVGNWDRINIPKKAEFWTGVVRNMAIRQSDSVDRNVINDLYHIIRMPNTIHGDTGLIAKDVGSLQDLDGYDPMKEAIAFKDGEMRVHVEKAGRLAMNGMEWGPYENADVTLPTYAAMYLVLKRVAAPA